MSSSVLVFSPIYLPGIYPTWSELMILGNTFCNRIAKHLVKILQFVCKRLTGLQFDRCRRSFPTFGIGLRTPLLCSWLNILFSNEYLKL